MKVIVAGKGGAGKTTLSGTVARALARAGHPVLALDGDTNPMLGISLGVGPEQTDLLVAARQAVDEGEAPHATTTEELVDAFGTDAPDGVRLVVVSRIDRPDPGCPCCGISPQQLLRELEARDRFVVGDLEAGLGTVLRLEPGETDLVLIVAQPTAKSLDVARRAIEAATDRAGVIVVANRVRDEADVELVRAVAGDHEVMIVPDDPGIAGADRDGTAPIDVDPDGPGVRAIVAIADRLGHRTVAAA